MLRVLRREPAAGGGHWCIAQNDYGRVGLLPLLLINTHTPQNKSHHSNSQPYGSAAAATSANNAVMPVGGGGPQGKKVGRGGAAIPFVPKWDRYLNAAEEWAEAEAESAAAATPGANGTVDVLSISAETTSEEEEEEEEGNVRERERERERAAAAAAETPEFRQLASYRCFTDANANTNNTAGQRQGRRRVAAQAVHRPSCEAWRAGPEARRLLAELAHTQRECSWLRTAETPVATARAGLAAAVEAAERAAAAAAAERQQRLEKQAEAAAGLAERLAAVQRLRAELLEAPVFSLADYDGPRGGVVLAERNANALVLASGKGKGKAPGGGLAATLAADLETLEAYAGQRAALAGRLAVAEGWTARLREESAALRASERALATLVGPDDYTIDADTEGGGDSDAGGPPRLRARMREGFAWPPTLAGLTPEEEAAVDNYVRLADKYAEKRARVVAAVRESLGGGAGDGEAEEEEALRQRVREANRARVQELRARVDDGCEQLIRVRGELAHVRELVARYQPVAARIEEQIEIGNRVLAQKREYCEQWTHQH